MTTLYYRPSISSFRLVPYLKVLVLSRVLWIDFLLTSLSVYILAELNALSLDLPQFRVILVVQYNTNCLLCTFDCHRDQSWEFSRSSKSISLRHEM